MLYKKTLIRTLPTAILSIVILSLGISDKLQYYIHPRYIVFTIVFAALALTLTTIFVLTDTEKRHVHEETKSISRHILLGICAVALFLPATSISSDLAVSRTTPATSNTSTPSVYDSFTTDFSHFTIKDWSSALSNIESSKNLSGKQTKIVGFLLRQNESFQLARYQLTCCAVDATPITVEIRDHKGRLEPLREGTWLEISGESVISDESGYINAREVEVIDEPNEPYVY